MFQQKMSVQCVEHWVEWTAVTCAHASEHWLQQTPLETHTDRSTLRSLSTLPLQPLLAANQLNISFPLAVQSTYQRLSWPHHQLNHMPKYTHNLPVSFPVQSRWVSKTVCLVVLVFWCAAFPLKDTPGNCLSVLQCGWHWRGVRRGPLGSSQLDLFFNLEGLPFRISLRWPNDGNLAALGSHFVICSYLLWIYAAHWISVFQFPIRRGRPSASCWSFRPKSVFIDAFGLEELFVVVKAVEVSVERDAIPQTANKRDQIVSFSDHHSHYFHI